MRKLTAAGCVLWIAGMAAFIIGMNLEGDVKEWISVGGSIAFFIGLGITGVVWMTFHIPQSFGDSIFGLLEIYIPVLIHPCDGF